MRTWLPGGIVATCLIAVFAPARAADPPMATTEVRIVGLSGGRPDSLERAGLAFYADGDYEDALDAFQAGIRRGGRGADADARAANLAQLYSNLAWLYRDTDRFPEADSILRLALDIDRRLDGEDSPAVARRTAELGMLHQAAGRYATAAPLLDRAIALYAKNPKADPREIAFTLHLVARNYHATGDIKQSEDFYKKVLDDLDEDEMLDANLWSQTMLDLAELYHATHRSKEARQTFERALARANKVFAAGGLPNALVLSPYSVLARRAEAVRARADTAALD